MFQKHRGFLFGLFEYICAIKGNRLKKVFHFILALIAMGLSYQSLGQFSQEQLQDSLSKYVRTQAYDQIIYFAKTQIENWEGSDTINNDYARAILAVSRSFAQLESYQEALPTIKGH